MSLCQKESGRFYSCYSYRKTSFPPTTFMHYMSVFTCQSLHVCLHLPIITCLSSPAKHYMSVFTCQSLHVCLHLPIITCLSSPANHYMSVFTCQSLHVCLHLPSITCLSSPANHYMSVFTCQYSRTTLHNVFSSQLVNTKKIENIVWSCIETN